MKIILEDVVTDNLDVLNVDTRENEAINMRI